MSCETFWPLHLECSGRGTCVNGTCVCNHGWSGDGLMMRLIDDQGHNIACYSNKYAVIGAYSVALLVGTISVFIALWKLLSVISKYKWPDIYNFDKNLSVYLLIIFSGVGGICTAALVIGGFKITTDVTLLIFVLFSSSSNNAVLTIMSLRLTRVIERVPHVSRFSSSMTWIKTVQYITSFVFVTGFWCVPMLVFFSNGSSFRVRLLYLTIILFVFTFIPQTILYLVFTRRIIHGLNKGIELSGNAELVKPTIKKLKGLRLSLIIPSCVIMALVFTVLLFIALMDYLIFIAFCAHNAGLIRITWIVLKENNKNSSTSSSKNSRPAPVNVTVGQ